MTLDLGRATPLAWSEPGRTTLEIKTGAWRSRRPVYIEAEAPCRPACPAGEPIARWIERARDGDYTSAWSLIREDNPFPAVTGRVCGHPCEAACNRAAYDGAVAINALERFVGDWGLEHGVAEQPPAARRPGRVAVVGGGPAGLTCAHHLARSGHAVTIFEAEPRLGGLLRHGIPEYRLPRAVVEGEIELILALGVEVVIGARLGTTLAWETLAGYDGLFLACGAAVPLALGVPGEEARGVGDGLGVLRAVNAGERPSLGARVVVVGGGSTAMDVARTARRLGASSVTVLALEPRASMPAADDEVAQALTEGVAILNGVSVRRFAATAGVLHGVEVTAASLGRGPDGTLGPVFEPGPSRVLPADAALLAVGQRADLSPVVPWIHAADGLVAVDADGRTSALWVFAGGDVASRRRTVAEAIGGGTRAARSIETALAGDAGRLVDWRSGEERHGFAGAPRPDQIVGPARINLAHVPRARRAVRWERLPGDRVRCFVEVQHGLREDAARAESARCFTCGRCTFCDTCLHVCPDMAIARDGRGYRIATEHCKGCGLCATECPRGALEMISDGR